MKKYLTFDYAVNFLIGLITIALFFNLYFGLGNRPVTTDLPESDDRLYTVTNKLKSVDPVISLDTPHYLYEKLRADIRKTRNLKNGEWLESGGVRFGDVIATGGAIVCDTCTMNHPQLDKPGARQSYIKLLGWKLKERNGELGQLDSVRFFVENGQGYIRKPVVDRVDHRNSSTLVKVHWADVPVRFRYDTSQDCVMIPVTHSVKKACDWIVGALGVVVVGFAGFLIFALFKIMFNISRGNAFPAENIKRLRLITISFLCYPLLILLLNFAINLIFSAYLTDDVIMNPALWRNWWIFLFLGLAFLLLFKAFRQGKLYNEELQLTV